MQFNLNTLYYISVNRQGKAAISWIWNYQSSCKAKTKCTCALDWNWLTLTDRQVVAPAGDSCTHDACDLLTAHQLVAFSAPEHQDRADRHASALLNIVGSSPWGKQRHAAQVTCGQMNRRDSEREANRPRCRNNKHMDKYRYDNELTLYNDLLQSISTKWFLAWTCSHVFISNTYTNVERIDQYQVQYLFNKNSNELLLMESLYWKWVYIHGLSF